MHAAQLRERAEFMLLGEGDRPRASCIGRVASEATNGLLIDGRHAILTLWHTVLAQLIAWLAST